jgi:hypothetical protein
MKIQDLEQVHVRGIFCRSLRLELVAGLGFALAIPALAFATENQGMATQTSLVAETQVQGGHTQATLSVHVLGADGQPATGTVNILDHGKPLAGIALNSEGSAKTALAISGSAHDLTAVYAGDSTHRLSTSSNTEVKAMASASSSTFDYEASVSPASLTLKAGQVTGNTATLTLTPSNASTLTTPVFITLDCTAGLPDESSCTPYPATLEILPTSTAATAPTATLTFVTVAASGTTSRNQDPLARVRPYALAVIFPGALGLAGLAWGTRRRRWLSRLSMMALVGMVVMVGATGCNPRYGYLNHAPNSNIATPSGSYTVTISAQTSDGVTATNRTTSMALTIN